MGIRKDVDDFWNIIQYNYDQIRYAEVKSSVVLSVYSLFFTAAYTLDILDEENIYAEEGEDVLAKSPDVRGVAVIGMPDSRWGEKVTAFIEPETDNASEKQLDDFCLTSNLARFKRPRAYAFIEKIPRSASGKLMRRHLRTGNYKL